MRCRPRISYIAESVNAKRSYAIRLYISFKQTKSSRIVTSNISIISIIFITKCNIIISFCRRVYAFFNSISIYAKLVVKPLHSIDNFIARSMHNSRIFWNPISSYYVTSIASILAGGGSTHKLSAATIIAKTKKCKIITTCISNRIRIYLCSSRRIAVDNSIKPSNRITGTISYMYPVSV